MVEEGDVRMMRDGTLVRVKEFTSEYSAYWRCNRARVVVQLVDNPRVTFTRAVGTVDGWPLYEEIEVRELGDIMKVELTITVRGDNDPSCNVYTYSETFEYRLSDPPTPAEIQARNKEVQDKFMESWPNPRVNKPTILRVEANVKTVNK